MADICCRTRFDACRALALYNKGAKHEVDGLFMSCRSLRPKRIWPFHFYHVKLRTDCRLPTTIDSSGNLVPGVGDKVSLPRAHRLSNRVDCCTFFFFPLFTFISFWAIFFFFFSNSSNSYNGNYFTTSYYD